MVDGQGHVSLLYPRQDHKFGSSPSDGSARDTVHSPEAQDEGLKMKGPGGLETVLLLVRRTPLPPSTDLAAAIGPCRRHPCATSSKLRSEALTKASGPRS